MRSSGTVTAPASINAGHFLDAREWLLTRPHWWRSDATRGEGGLIGAVDRGRQAPPIPGASRLCAGALPGR